MLMPYLEDKKALDVFAGSGALGIEGLSRGFSACDFIERDKQAYDTLCDNLKTLDIKEPVHTMREDALHALRQMHDPYDIIILDPPYSKGLVEQALALIAENDLLKPQGLVVILCGKNETFTIPDRFTTLKNRTVGVTKIQILESGEKS